jgi:outer membrane protein assembly factor BamA
VRCADLARAVKRQRRILAPVRNFLDSLGFFHARWDSAGPKRFSIHPSARAVIGAEKITGADSLGIDSLPPFTTPRPYDAGELRTRAAQIGRFCAERGYPYASISLSLAPPPAAGIIVDRQDTMTAVFRVQVDRKCFFAPPRLSGMRSTGQALLLNDVTVRGGDLFDIRKIEESVERLNGRPYVAAATAGTIAVVPESMRERDTAERYRNADFVEMPILVRDRSGLGLEGALGYNSQGGAGPALQGDLKLSFSNVFHSGENAAMVYAGDRTYQKFHIEAAKPWFLGRPLSASAAFGMEIHQGSYGFLSGEATLLAELANRWQAGIGLKGSETTDDSLVDSSSGSTWRYYGADFLLIRQDERLRDGIFSHELSLSTGGGFSSRDRVYTRSHFDFTLGLHLPLWMHQALHLRLISKYLRTDESTIVAAEMYRVGGYRSVRGYQDDEFAFRTVAYDQLEYLLYFSETGSAFVFADGGIGFERSLSLVHWSERREFLGYGLGIRVPAKLGTLTLAWARNIDDTKSLGRVHVLVQNPLSSGNK